MSFPGRDLCVLVFFGRRYTFLGVSWSGICVSMRFPVRNKRFLAFSIWFYVFLCVFQSGTMGPGPYGPLSGPIIWARTPKSPGPATTAEHSQPTPRPQPTWAGIEYPVRVTPHSDPPLAGSMVNWFYRDGPYSRGACGWVAGLTFSFKGSIIHGGTLPANPAPQPPQPNQSSPPCTCVQGEHIP